MRANWWGLAGERVNRLVGRISKSEAISGIPGSPVNHHGAPYSLTEEFVAVYRMHPLIPDDIPFRSHLNNAALPERTFHEPASANPGRCDEQMPRTDLPATYGTPHPDP